ncbi:CADM3 [Mytilus edulis]|uniref:CADM3 n=1 Tax=Mytilus edulis TaxID=6550 RepID=A0A8S3SFY8_MYTED|nr:CADM3 [Mytilus edulis]
MRIVMPPEKPNTLYMKDTFALFKETDNATFICEGNVGNPKGKLIWQKQRIGENVSEVNTDIQTDYIKIEKYCSYVGMSSFTITLSDKDNQAVISCAEESLRNNNAMFRYSQPINVLFKARTLRIIKFPNISTYSEGIDIIILTCISRGNPLPTYVWYLNEALTHVGSVLNIKNGRESESGRHKRGRINKRNNSTETNNPEPHYATVAETEYVRPGQPYNHEYNKISKSKKRESGHIQATEGEQPQQNTDRPSEDLNSSTNSYIIRATLLKN